MSTVICCYTLLYYSSKEYACTFKTTGIATGCECKVEVMGFVIGEIFNTALLKGGNVLFAKELQTGTFRMYTLSVFEFYLFIDSLIKTFYVTLLDRSFTNDYFLQLNPKLQS